MKKLLAVLAGVSAVAMATPASASAVITTGVITAIPSNNDFQAQLNGLGLFNYTDVGAAIALTAPAVLSFDFLGSESGFSDTFTAVGSTMTGAFIPTGFTCSGASCTEHSGFENHFGAPVAMGSGVYGAGPLAGLLNFTSSGGLPATIGGDGFGIFIPAGVSGVLAPTDVFYIGYDDFGAGPDDNHDDFIVRVTLSPAVPEPATWGMMLLGFGAMGMIIRRSRKTTIAQIA